MTSVRLGGYGESICFPRVHGEGVSTHPRADDPEPDVAALKLLGNATTRALLRELATGGPSYPRALATTLGASEGDVQHKLHRLERAGLVRGAWAHQGKTVKEYKLAATGIDVRLVAGVSVHLRKD